MFKTIQDCTTIRLDDKIYWVQQEPTPGPVIANNEDFFEPCTVLNIDASWLTSKYVKEIPTNVEETFAKFSQVDDVWSHEFSRTVVLQIDCACTENIEDILEELKHCFAERGIGGSVIDVSQRAQLYPEAPFFLQEGHLYAPYLLYPDTAGAFVVSTISEGDDSRYKSLDASVWGERFPSTLSIAVPSRLMYTKTEDRPFAGDRIAIKDNIDLKGLRTGASSRAYTELYGPRPENAPVVQELIDLGCVVVGKTRTTQFADSEWPTADWVEYLAPFNPRADGYQTPSASSSGSAAAIAAYDWLDYSIGTDTLGSVRAPASAQGIFGIRPSHGATSTDGVIPYSSLADTVGCFSRDAKSLAKLCSHLCPLSDTLSCTRRPRRLLYPLNYWPVAHRESQELFEAFISKLESFLDVKREAIDMHDLWRTTSPGDTELSLAKYFDETFMKTHLDQRNFLDKVVEDWKSWFNGVPPIFNPQIRFKINEFLPTITKEVHEEGAAEYALFKTWFEQNVIPPAENGCSDTLIVFPWSTGTPDYRDGHRQPQNFTGKGFNFYNWSTYAGTPEIIVPVGQTPYHSKVTERTEYLPAAIGIMSARGSDVMLAEVVRDFMESIGMGEGVRTGPVAFQEQNDSASPGADWQIVSEAGAAESEES